MNIFFLIIDFLLPITFILLLPFFKYCIKKGINDFIGFRTNKAKLNVDNWQKANLLFGKYFFILGIFSTTLTIVIRVIKPFVMEINSLILSVINIILMLVLIIVIDRKI